MRTIGRITLCGVLLLAGLALNAQEAQQKAAREGAESWLALVDDGQYAESWDEAASMFKDKVARAKWETMLAAGRKPLGELKSRSFASAHYTTEMPGAPDGEYVILQYKASYANKKSATETITPMLDKDGKWRVSGYFIR